MIEVWLVVILNRGEWEEKGKESQISKGRRTHPFDGAASLLLPLVAAQLQGAVNIGFSLIGAEDEQSAEMRNKTYDKKIEPTVRIYHDNIEKN